METITKTQQLNPEEIWAALLADPTFATEYEILTESHRPFVMALPSIFNDYIESQITPSLLMNLRSMYLAYCIENDYVSVVSGGRLNGAFQKELRNGIERYASAARSIDKYIEEHPNTIVQWLQDFGLNDQCMTLYSQGALTVHKLLITQPMAVISTPTYFSDGA